MKVNTNIVIFKILLLIVLIFLPFSLSDYSDTITPEKITSDLRFYEINTCSISLFEFLLENPNVVYQDHYKIRFNNYSSISCFGQITGIDQIGYTFFISIGTNTILNLFLQTIFWILLISFIPKKMEISFKVSNLVSFIFLSTLFCFVFYSEQRFYSKSLFEFDLNRNNTYLYIFVYFLFVSIFSFYFLNSRDDNIINFLPFAYLIIGVYSGTNIYFLSVFFSVYGIQNILTNKKIRKKFTNVNLLILFWSFNAVGLNYYLKPDKVRGLSSSVYNFLSVFSWSLLMLFSIFGLYIFIKNRLNSFDLIKIRNSFSFVGICILILGYIGSSMPLINFLNYYYFGQTKYGTDNQNLFSVNYWGESEAWRGFFPSAETIGEFYAIALIVIFITRRKTSTMKSYLIYFSIPFLVLGLYASNNKAAFISMLFCILLLLNFEYQFKKKTLFIFLIPVLFILLYFIRLENFLYSFDFSSNKMIDMAISYSNEGSSSSATEFLKNIDEMNLFIKIPILLFGFIAFLINRSELWGIFFARFNPTISEFLFGTGPFILSDHYSQVDIIEKRLSTGTPLGFLLPHSSMLLLLVYFGIIGLFTFLIYTIYVLKKGKTKNFNIYIVCLFILLNLTKSDSILYLPSLITYVMFYVKLRFGKNLIHHQQ